MKIKPVNKKYRPDYPSKNEILKKPSFVMQICRQWNKKVIKASAVGLILSMLLTACEKEEQGSYTIQNEETEKFSFFDKGKKLEKRRKEILESRMLLMPTAIMQPYQLTEEEAWNIIERKAREYGLEFEHNSMTIDNIVLELDNYNNPEKDLMPKEDLKQLKESHSLTLDGYDETKKVGIEYIALPTDLTKKELNLEELIYIYQLSGLLNDALKKNHEDKHIKIIIGTTYNKKNVEEILEKQLDEFFTQLKEEKIIE